MKIKKIVIFFLFSLLLMFYPGDFYYFRIFAYQKDLFYRQEKKLVLKSQIPYLKNISYPEVEAEGIYVIDLYSFTPIFEKNHHKKFLPASTVKLLSALVALEKFQLNDILTVKRIITEPQTMGLVFGERISFENLLYGLLVHSGNDAALALADNYPGGEKEFVKKMNEKAKKLMMRNSFFKNPTGFDEIGQYTTPFDLALLSREVLKNKILARMVATKRITVFDEDFKYFHQLENVNRLLGEIPGLGGLKTGYTENAGENLISFYKKDGHQFLIVVLKSQDRFSDTKKIVDWINTNVDYLMYSSLIAGT